MIDHALYKVEGGFGTARCARVGGWVVDVVGQASLRLKAAIELQSPRDSPYQHELVPIVYLGTWAEPPDINIRQDEMTWSWPR